MQDQNIKTQNPVPSMPTSQMAGVVPAVPSQPVAAQPAQPVQLMMGQPAVGQPVVGQPTTGQPVAGQAAASQPAAPRPTQPAAAQPAAAQAAQQTVNRAASKAEQSAFVRKIVEKIRNSENILVALSRDPSVDEIAAAIGLTLFLDGLQKHTTAIYSGETPSALAFLQPEGTFETNTDSLRDFIIALSKDKADHLRYKLEGDFVKVYITPYKTNLSEEDLEFSYGDFNVNLVLGLGIPSAADLDEALSEYGRIMHDATTVDITVDVPGKFAEIEWSDPAASSVSEMVTKLIFTMQGKDAILDKEIATALLTGIVAATGRFSNSKTNSDTMQLASKLMSMGADQQLIAAHVMDNDGNQPDVAGYDAEPRTDDGSLLVGRDYNISGAVPAEAEVADEMVNVPQMTTATVVSESSATEPVIPDLLKKQEADRAAMQAAAAAAVSEAVASATASAAAVGATGAGIPQMMQMNPAVQPTGQSKDYAQMMEQALAEKGTQSVPQPVASSQVQPVVQPGANEQKPVAEPVVKVEGVVLPPPPEPVAPALPGVQVPNE